MHDRRISLTHVGDTNQKARSSALLLTKPRISSRMFLVIVSVLAAAVVVDSQISLISDFIADTLVTSGGIALFIGIAAIFIVSQHFILGYISDKNKEQKAKALHLNITQVGVRIAQYVLASIFIIVIAQMYITSQYSSALLVASTGISYMLANVMFALLTRGFLSWYRTSSKDKKKKKNAMIIVFAMAMTATVVYTVGAVVLLLGMLQQQPEIIASDRVAFFPEFEPDSLMGQVQSWYQIAAAVFFVLTWIGTVLLLYPYSKKFGKAKFWAVMGFAVFYHTIQIPLFELGWYTPSENSDAMTNILIFSVVGLFSGIIFGAAFLSVARTLPKGSPLRSQMMIAAFGFLLFYVVGGGTASQAAYPPFGLVSVSVVGLASYMIYTGLYSSAISVSQDLELRQSIRKSAMEQSKLLDSMGTAQMEVELQGRVLSVAKNQSEALAEQTGIEPSMTEDDMKEYLEIVVNELKGAKVATGS
jgi:hypothetical protein